VSNPDDRPPILADAAGALAYAKWLQANGLEDSDTAAWRFAAEVAGSPATATPTPPPTPPAARTRAKRRWWIPVSIVAGVLVLLAGAAVYTAATAERWTKIDVAAKKRFVNVPTGKWVVWERERDPVCVKGQSYLGCIDDMTAEYTTACTVHPLAHSALKVCDSYFDRIQSMKSHNASAFATVEFERFSTGAGRLGVREKIDRQLVVVTPEESHEAVCYLGFLGECPTPEDADQSP